MRRSKDADAPFDKSVKDKIRKTYNNRCAICLQDLPRKGRHCAHLFDSSRIGAKQVSAVEITRRRY